MAVFREIVALAASLATECVQHPFCWEHHAKKGLLEVRPSRGEIWTVDGMLSWCPTVLAAASMEIAKLLGQRTKWRMGAEQKGVACTLYVCCGRRGDAQCLSAAKGGDGVWRLAAIWRQLVVAFFVAAVRVLGMMSALWISPSSMLAFLSGVCSITQQHGSKTK